METAKVIEGKRGEAGAKAGSVIVSIASPGKKGPRDAQMGNERKREGG